jgi:predicted  nucleic acid-binding Zn-ribbon protein
VQELDSRHDHLRQQAANLPESGELRRLAAERSELDGSARDLQVQVDDLTRAQRKADEDVEQVKARRTRDQRRLDEGAVGAKDAGRLQHEIVSLDRRIRELEDVELEVMEQLETAQKELAARRRELADLDARAAELTAARDQRLGRLREEAATVTRDRSAAAAGMPAELLALYERLREQKNGVGAAHLRSRRCGGCSLELNSAELAGIAKLPPDEVVRCEECSRILVRTGESGL